MRINEIIHIKESKHSSCCLPEFWSGFPLEVPCTATACRGQHPRSNPPLLWAKVLAPFKFRADKSKLYKTTECTREMPWHAIMGRIKKYIHL